jgi:type II secretory pathway component PulF
MKKRQNRKEEKQELAESAEQVREKIRKQGYEFFELRGKEDGSDLDDWLTAESAVTGKG